MNSTDQGMLEKVRRSFLRMTNQREFGSDEAERAVPFFTENIPPMLANADAAYDFAYELLHRDLIVLQSDAERMETYRHARRIVEMILGQYREIQGRIGMAVTELDFSIPVAYMELIRRQLDILILAAEGQAQGEVAESAAKKPSPAQRFLANALRDQDVIYGSLELNTLHFLQGVLDDHAAAYAKLRQQYRKNFTKEDSQRYQKAFDAYQQSHRLTPETPK